MTKIGDIPNGVTNAGLDFNFNVWTANSRITLCNVPWGADYRDVISPAFDLENYINNLTTAVINLDRVSYLKVNEPINLSVAFNAAYKFNYLRVTNAGIPNDQTRTYYYFISNVEFVSPMTTRFYIQLDVWATFRNSVTFGQCYLERGHVGIANSKQMENNGREYLTTPEGFDVGGEYAIATNYANVIAQNGNISNPHVLVASNLSWEKSGGTVEKPVIASAEGSMFEGMPNAAEVYWFPSIQALQFELRKISKLPFIAAGIISIMAVPDLGTPPTDTFTPGYSSSSTIHKIKSPKGAWAVHNLNHSNNWREELLRLFYPARYRHLKKFLTYPYTLVELTTNTGTPLVLKPESMHGTDIAVTEMQHLSLPDPRVMFFPYKYNALKFHGTDQYPNGSGHPDTSDNPNDGAEFLDMATGITNFPTFSVLNNSYMQFMANNSNSLAFQHSSADWSQQKALQGNALGAAQATAGMSNTYANAQIGMGAQQASNDISTQAAAMQTGLNVAGSLVGGALSGPGGLAGAGMGAVSQIGGQMISTDAQNRQTANSLAAQRGQLGNNQNLGAYMRDSNKAYADMAANGDYSMAIGAINAKVQDAKMVQPTTAGQLGGDAFLLAAYKWEILAKVKTVMPNAMAILGEYWLRYGYAINRFVKPPASLMAMSKFTYWKMKETYLTSSECSEPHRQAIRGLFEKGVTVWSDPDDMGRIDIADNDPEGGISL